MARGYKCIFLKKIHIGLPHRIDLLHSVGIKVLHGHNCHAGSNTSHVCARTHTH